MKRIFSLLMAVAICVLPAFSLVSCSQSEEVRTINIYNWGEYISDGSEDSYDTNAEFELYWNENLKEKYGYKIKVNYSTYASNEDMYNKIVSGSAKYDVIFPSDYMVARMISEDMLYDFKPQETIENYEYIDEAFKGLFYDPNNQYSVPYAYGVVGVIYNTDYVSEDSDGFGTWNLMWNEEYKGKILQFNNPRDAFGTSLYRLGYDVNTENKEEWKRAFDELAKQKPLVQSYVMDEIFNKMSTASSWIASYYAGDFLTMHGDNDSLDFYYPEDGTNIYVDAMCIPKNSPNPEAAIEYINFMLSSEAAIANAEYTCYATPNRLVYEDEEYIEYINDCYGGENFESGMDILYCSTRQIDEDTDYSDTEQVHVSYYHAIENTEENGYLLNYTNDLWESLKIEDSGSSWIYITATVIVILLLVWAGYGYFIRRSRESKY